MGREEIELLLHLKSLLEAKGRSREEFARWLNPKCPHLNKESLTCNLREPREYLTCFTLEEQKHHCALAVFALRLWG